MGVWTVFKDTIGISEKQLQKFRELEDTEGGKLTLNFRPTQPVNNRQILDVSTSTKRFSSNIADSSCQRPESNRTPYVDRRLEDMLILEPYINNRTPIALKVDNGKYFCIQQN